MTWRLLRVAPTFHPYSFYLRVQLYFCVTAVGGYRLLACHCQTLTWKPVQNGILGSVVPGFFSRL